MPKTVGTWDYVIVGAGTAGCVLANRLSAERDVSVLLLEAGGKDDWIWIHIPVSYSCCIGYPVSLRGCARPVSGSSACRVQRRGPHHPQ